MKLIPHSLTPGQHVRGIRSLTGIGTLTGPYPISALPPLHSYPRLVLKLFRGERAISEFDWPFTPTHSSSPGFSTPVGSDLHPVLPGIHPGHG